MNKAHIQEKVQDVAESTVTRLASGVHEAVDKASGMAAQVADNIEAKGVQLKDIQEQWLENSRRYIGEHPVKSLGIAVVAGFLLSRILSAR